MNSIGTNPFLMFHALGYERLVPIVPPDAEISEKSSLSRAINTKADPRGKAVGIRGHNGQWYGFDWIPHEADADDLIRWHRMGAGLGIKTGNGLLGIDADTKDDNFARIIRDTVEKHFGRTPIRVGNYPKALYLIRTSAPYRYTRVEFGERDEKGRLLERVEILSDGRQFVAHGIHPATRKPYHWPRPIVPLAELSTFSPEQIDAFMADLSANLPQASELVREGASTDVNQDALKGELTHVRKAVRATPNTTENFPTREAYRDYGYAIKAALPDYPNEALALYEEWCDEWIGPGGETNAKDQVNSDWRRMKPPFRRGAGYLYELAEKYSAGKFTHADIWFEPPAPEDTNPFPKIELNASEATDTYRLLTIDEIVNRPPPSWLIDRHIPEKGLGFLYSEPGAGKSFLALDIGLHIAAGVPEWNGDAINADPGAAVIYIAGEGSYGFRNRIAAWQKSRPPSENIAKRFFLIEQAINFMADEDIKRLLRTLDAATKSGARPCLVFVDTVSRALPGADENLQKDMTVFVRACDAVRDRFGCTVLGVHHAGKAGDMRGSTVLKGAGDFVFHLQRRKGATIGQLECEKQKDGPDGWVDSYQFERVDLEAGETSLVVARVGGEMGVAIELTPDTSARVLEAMRAAWDDGRPWSRAPQSKDRYAVRRMVADFGFDGAKAEEALMIWEQTGLVRTSLRSPKSKLTGLEVVGDLGQAVRDEGILG